MSCDQSVRRPGGVGQAPLPAVTAAAATCRRTLAWRAPASAGSAAGTTQAATPGSASWPPWMREIPGWMYACLAAGMLLFVIGIGTYGQNTTKAQSCTVASVGRFSLVHKSPECDAARSGVSRGEALMAGGFLLAVVLRAKIGLSRRSTPP